MSCDVRVQCENVTRERKNKKENGKNDMSKPMCFGVGNVDSICYACSVERGCQEEIRNTICGLNEPLYKYKQNPIEAIEQLKKCKFECQVGALENSVAFIALEEFVGYATKKLKEKR